MQEIWKPIPGYEGIYEVSNLGRVKSLPRMYAKSKHATFLKPAVFRNGYVYFCLTKDRKYRSVIAHRLVAKAFIANTENKPQINHIDGDKTNNAVSNLEWSSRSENINHAHKNGLIKPLKGSRSPIAKITESDIAQIKDLIKCNLFTQKEIGDFYGICFQSVSLIKLNKTWTHVKRSAIEKSANNIHVKGQLNPSSKLTNKDSIEIKDLLRCRLFTQQEIADIYDVSKSTISDIKHNRSWCHII